MEKNAKIRLAYSVFLGIFTIIVGALFLAEASDLYFSGVQASGATQGMYSRKEVGARLKVMLIPLCLWIVSIVEGAVVYALYPVTPKRSHKRDDRKIYARLRKKALREKDPDGFSRLLRAERIRLGVRIFTAAFCLLAAVMCIIYLADASHFTSLAALNTEILHMVAYILPWTGASLVLLIAESVFEGLFAKKYLPCLKPLVGASVPSAQRDCRIPAITEHKYVRLALRLSLFALAVVFFVLGIMNGGAHDVFIKAINICTECIGLG